MLKDRITESILATKLFKTLIASNQSKFTEEDILLLSKNLIRTLSGISEKNSVASIEEYQACFSDLDDRDLSKVLKVLQDIFAGEEHKEFRKIIELPLLDRLTTQFKIERIQELNNQQAGNFNKNLSNNNIEELLRDKNIAKQEEFSPKGPKQAGISAGYIATEKSSGNTFLLKQFYKSNTSAKKSSTSILCCIKSQTSDQYQSDMIDAIQELLASQMYQLLLYDRAPKEALTMPDKLNSKFLYIRSKFLKNAVTLSEFSGLKGVTCVDPRASCLKQLDGFEKVIAACHMLGDIDYHGANLMVLDGKTVAKIDHGRSFMQYHKDFASMVSTTYKSFKRESKKYDLAIQCGNLRFDINKYNTALKKMIGQLNEDQIDAIIEQKVAELRKLGFNPNDLIVRAGFESGIVNSTVISDYKDLEEFYKKNLKKNLQNMKEIAKATNIVAKFSNVSQEFKEGGWLKAFATSTIQDPVLYAHNTNIAINKKRALEWAIANNYDIKHYDSDIYYDWQQEWLKSNHDKLQKIKQCVLEQEKKIVEFNAADCTIESENHQKSLSNKIDFLSSSKEVLLKSEVSHKFDINQKKEPAVFKLKPKTSQGRSMV
ncbi:hypothetical protein [Orientia tsutsugamushi]|uniref:Uncharacterized protein n=1 Tax=Orientia tsutsugamushi TaxID=784 RepID=A0A2U3QMU1_ORITS|nr:hypothetical protein [Orientia tsutsugamushi]KJV56697.1 hypothetical protein OTSKATO_0213 [Orientia tsutsugamushi str. Kato PP]SPR02260.1 Uncharacterised protein [Orientia tsutsugamushi]